MTVLGDKVTETEHKQSITRTEIIDNVADASGISTTKSNNGKNKVTEKVTEKDSKLIEKLIEKASINGDRLTENKLSILQYMMDDPYISRSDLAKYVGISENSISRNIEAMRGKYLRRVGPDKGGFGEVLMD